jgi:short-subunit dehydrogenase
LSSAHATSLALLAMQKAHAAGLGRIINVASAHGWSSAEKSAYVAASTVWSAD